MKNKTALIILLILLVLGVIIWRDAPSASKAPVHNETNDIEEKSLENEESKEERGVREVEDPNTMQELIIGEWRSTDDTQSVISFERSGEMSHIYAGGAVNESGTYQIFSRASSLPDEFLENLPNLPEVSGYLRQSFSEEDYYYTIAGLDQERLVLVHLPRGNFLEYRRVNN